MLFLTPIIFYSKSVAINFWLVHSVSITFNLKLHNLVLQLKAIKNVGTPYSWKKVINSKEIIIGQQILLYTFESSIFFLYCTGTQLRSRSCLHGNIGQTGCATLERFSSRRCATNSCASWSNWQEHSCPTTCGSNTRVSN